MDDEFLLNDFAFRCFRDVADGDYIAARMAYRAGLTIQFLWACEQVIEKYLKCALLLNCVAAPKIGHSLDQGVSRLEKSGI